MNPVKLLFSRRAEVYIGDALLFTITGPYDTTVHAQYAAECQQALRQLLEACGKAMQGSELPDEPFGDFELTKFIYNPAYSNVAPLVLAQVRDYVECLCAGDKPRPVQQISYADQTYDLRITSASLFTVDEFLPGRQLSMYLEYADARDSDDPSPLEDIRCFFTAAAERWQSLTAVGCGPMSFMGTEYIRIGNGSQFTDSEIAVTPDISHEMAHLSIGDTLNEIFATLCVHLG